MAASRLSLIARQTPNQLSVRSIFYTQRKRPATSDETLTLVVGIGSLLASAGVVSTQKKHT